MRRCAMLAGFLGSTMAAVAVAQSPAVLSDADVRAIISRRVDQSRHGTAMVVGIIDAGGRRVIAHGSPARGDSRAVDGDTVFEIGSVTKVFTALALADAVERGVVSLDDPVATLLPGVRMPERGRAITVRDLVTHTSGLPRLPSNMTPKNADDPYADYTTEQLYAFLASYALPRDVGAQYEYSNLGAGLLGHALSRKAGASYEALIESRVLKPLGMRSTSITLAASQRTRLATGHGPTGEPVANWQLPTLAGAGALRSTANDMLTFVAAAMGGPSPLSKPLATLTATRRPTGTANLDIAYGWHITTSGGRDLVWHNGGTGGYRSFVGFDPAARIGVVVLSNAGTVVGVDDIGRHLLDRRLPLLSSDSPVLAPPQVRRTTQVDPTTFDRYVGRYQLAPQAIMTVSRKQRQFFAQLTGQPEFEVFPESLTKFFVKVVDAQISFEVGQSGPATALVLHQFGRDQRAPRIDGEPVVPKTVTLDTATLDGYVGRYQLAPQVVITVTRQETRLFAQLTGQPPAEVFASAPGEFFYTVVNAQLSFEVDGSGRATSVVLHQGRRDMKAPRVP